MLECGDNIYKNIKMLKMKQTKNTHCNLSFFFLFLKDNDKCNKKWTVVSGML